MVFFYLFTKMRIIEIHYKVYYHHKGTLLMAMLYSREHVSDNTAHCALTLSLDQCQGASDGLKPHCVPVGSLLVQYITVGQDTAEE